MAEGSVWNPGYTPHDVLSLAPALSIWQAGLGQAFVFQSGLDVHSALS